MVDNWDVLDPIRFIDSSSPKRGFSYNSEQCGHEDYYLEELYFVRLQPENNNQ